MASIIDMFKGSTPKTAKANTRGVDKTPIGTEFPFAGSKDLVKQTEKFRKGNVGDRSAGFNNSKPYSKSLKNK